LRRNQDPDDRAADDHQQIVARDDLLMPIIAPFLDEPAPEGKPASR
jgi:hypothetical protein